MPEVKNVSGVDREVPRLFARVLVKAGDTLEVPADEVESFTCQTEVWQSVKPSKTEKD